MRLGRKASTEVQPEGGFVKNVAPTDAWYSVNTNCVVCSPVPSLRGTSVDQTSVAFTGVGHGKLGSVGDVNGEPETNDVILAICGLLN